MLDRAIHRLRSMFLRFVNRRRFLNELHDELPTHIHDLLIFSYNKKIPSQDKNLGRQIENLRDAVVRDSEDQEVRTFGSPHSDVPLFDAEGRVVPGGFSVSDIRGVARTGTNIFGGIQLKRLVDTFGPGDVFELGTNTGLSGCYFLASQNTKELVTVEGSPELCAIADRNLSSMGVNFEILNCLFDDAISRIVSEDRVFKYAFIDGQHEEHATIHYMERLIPVLDDGGLLIFDDIYWSEGMYSAWKRIKEDARFDLCLDFGWRGVCRLRSIDLPSKEITFFDLTKYIGVPRFQRPGW